MTRINAITLIVAAVVLLGATEYVLGDFLYDNASQTLTGSAIFLIVAGTSALGAIVLLHLVERRLRNKTDAVGGYSRVDSVVPLVRSLLVAAVIVISLLGLLVGFGVDIRAMLAGAGVLGIVLGFGAQSLLKDILSGIFFVFEDAFRLGEYLEIGDLMGTVEAISLRSMKLRHHRGALQTIPYGQILSVRNHSRDWVIVKFELVFPHGTDMGLVKKLTKEVSAEVKAVPDYAPFILEALKTQGIDRIDLTGLTVRFKFMAVPGEQFTMRRDINKRLMSRFEENGIELARRTVQVMDGDPTKRAGMAADDLEEIEEAAAQKDKTV